jgi:hypothetical protein
MKRFSALFLFLGILALAVLFLSKGFFGGQVLQGGDNPYCNTMYHAAFVKDTAAWWSPYLWMGWDFGNLTPGLHTLMSKLLPAPMILPFAYAAAILLAFVFMFLFIRKLGLGMLPAAFAGIAWSLSPVFMSFIPAGHYTVIEMLPYPPALFYFLAILLDREEKDWLKIILSIVGAGAAWGMSIGSDPQRGLYYSFLAVAFYIFKLISNNGFSWTILLNIFPVIGQIILIITKKYRRETVLLILVSLVLAITFANGLQRWYSSFQSRENLSQSIQKSAAEKWDFSASYSHYPLDFVDNIAFGYFGLLSGDSDKPYWGGRQSGGEFKGNSTAIGFFAFLFVILGIVGFFFRDKMVHLFFWGGLAGLILSFGRFLPGNFLYWLYFQLPFMDRFRAPEKWMCLVAFAWAIVAGYGLAYVKIAIDEDRKKFFDTVLRALGIVFGIGIVWIFILFANQTTMGNDLGQKYGNYLLGSKMAENATFAVVRMCLLTVITFTAFFLLRRFQSGKFAWPVFAWAFVLLIAVELFSMDTFFVKRAWGDPNNIAFTDGVVQFLGNERMSEQFRVGTSLKMTDGRQVMDSVPTAEFYQKPTGIRNYYITSIFPYYGIEPFDVSATSGVSADYTIFMSEMLKRSMTAKIETIQQLIDVNLRLYRLANVKYFVFDEAYGTLTNRGLILTNIVSGADGKKKYIYFLDGYLPRASFYRDFVPAKDLRDSLKFTADPAFDIRSVAVIRDDVTARLEGTNASPAIPQRIPDYKPWRYTVEVNAPTDGYLVVMTRYVPDWKAKLDGKPAKLIAANSIGQGVAVPAGRHNVELRYEPDQRPFWINLGILVLFFLLAGVYGVKWLLAKPEKE